MRLEFADSRSAGVFEEGVHESQEAGMETGIGSGMLIDRAGASTTRDET